MPVGRNQHWHANAVTGITAGTGIITAASWLREFSHDPLPVDILL